MQPKKYEFEDRVEWRLYGYTHRVDGPAIEYHNGDKEWWFNGELHREDGPAIERTNGAVRWYKFGQLHRADGPATEFSSGYKGWWLMGLNFSSKEEWFKALTEEEKIAYLFNMKS
jgi:hypothetical protein